LLGGSFAGLKDISDSVTQASAAALSASQVIHSSGGSLALEPQPAPPLSGAAREIPRILAVVCTCGGKLSGFDNPTEIVHRLKTNPLVKQVEFLEQICTAAGWEQLVELVETSKPNRLLIGACLPYVYQRKLQELSRQVGLDPALMEVVDLRPVASTQGSKLKAQGSLSAFNFQLSALQTGIAKLKWVDPGLSPPLRSFKKRWLSAAVLPA
jgi:heterodisulfide reductase subunit A